MRDLTGGEPDRVTERAYDGNDRETSVTDPEGGVLSKVYDSAGNVIRVTDQEGRVYETAYNARNLPTTVTLQDFVDDPVAGSTPRDVVVKSMTYDAAGRKLTETDAEARLRRFVYDKADRVLTVTLEDLRTATPHCGTSSWRSTPTTPLGTCSPRSAAAESASSSTRWMRSAGAPSRALR